MRKVDMLLAILLLIGKSLGMERHSIQAAQEKSICPFKYYQDINEHRIPAIIEKVECIKTLPRLGQMTYVDEKGIFNRTCTCTEVYTDLTVEYRKGSHSRSDKMRYIVGCMCLNDTSQKSQEVIVPTVQ